MKTPKMPQVSHCDVTECSYNMDRKCHALAITVGDKSRARCDTFTRGGQKAGETKNVYENLQ